jgi:hypothetical protein
MREVARIKREKRGVRKGPRETERERGRRVSLVWCDSADTIREVEILKNTTPKNRKNINPSVLKN